MDRSWFFLYGLVTLRHSFCIFIVLFSVPTFIQSFITFAEVHLYIIAAAGSVGGLSWGAELRFELGPALQQASALLEFSFLLSASSGDLQYYSLGVTECYVCTVAVLLKTATYYRAVASCDGIWIQSFGICCPVPRIIIWESLITAYSLYGYLLHCLHGLEPRTVSKMNNWSFSHILCWTTSVIGYESMENV